MEDFRKLLAKLSPKTQRTDEQFKNALAQMAAEARAYRNAKEGGKQVAVATAEERQAEAERRRAEAEREVLEAARAAREAARRRLEEVQREQRELQATFNLLQQISRMKDHQLEATRRVDHNWRRVEHNKVVQAPRAARHSWSRLPLSLVGTLGVTLPTDPGNQAPTDHSLSLALANTASHFSTATILGNRRVLDDPLVSNIDLAQGHQVIVNEFTLNYQKALFRRLGPHIEKITLCDLIDLWPVFTSAMRYQQQFRRLEIFGQEGTPCLESLKALEYFKFSPRLPSLQQLEVGGHEAWQRAELKYFQTFFMAIAPYLRVLTLNGIYPLSPIRYQAMPNLHSLDVNLKTAACVTELLSPRGGLLKAVTLDKLQSFGLTFMYPSVNGSEDRVQKQLFTTIIGKMVNLQKLALEVIIGEAYEDFMPKKRTKKADDWKKEAKAALPKLTKLRVLHLKISGSSLDTGLSSITDYRTWIELFQVYVPGITKLVFHVAANLFHNCIHLDVNPKGGQWKKSLKSLVVNFTDNTSLTQAERAGARMPILFFIPPELKPPSSSLFSSLTTLTIISLPILNERILANIADCCTDLVEFNFSASSGDLYQSKELQQGLASPKSNPKNQQEAAFNFDATFASTIEKLKALRVLRFIDDFDKLLPQTITAMCRRAMADAAASGKHQQLGVQKKKCLLHVPLTSAFNQEVLAMVEVKELMDQAQAGVEIY